MAVLTQALSGHQVGSTIEAKVFLKERGIPQQPTDGVLIYALAEWTKNGCPLYLLDAPLARALVHTTPPMETFDLLPKVPVSGMYLSLPPIFSLHNDETGLHLVEGVYLMEDDVLVWERKTGGIDPRSCQRRSNEEKRAMFEDPSLRLVPRRGLTFLAVGQDRRQSTTLKDAWCRDDALVNCHIAPGVPMDPYYHDGWAGTAEMFRLVMNLIYLWQTTHHVATRVVPGRTFEGKDRAIRREKERFAANRKSASGYTLLHLDHHEAKAASTARALTEVVSTAERARHIVAGHIRRYWVLDPGEARVMETKEVHGKTRHAVARWMLPYWRGSGEVAATVKKIVL